jgi:hypothetical protein
MSKKSSIFLVPSDKYGDFWVCPISKDETDSESAASDLVSSYFEKILSPIEARETISKVHIANIIKYAKNSVNKTIKAYIHSFYEKNFVFVIDDGFYDDSRASQLVINIEKNYIQFAANEAFNDKVFIKNLK